MVKGILFLFVLPLFLLACRFSLGFVRFLLIFVFRYLSFIEILWLQTMTTVDSLMFIASVVSLVFEVINFNKSEAEMNKVSLSSSSLILSSFHLLLAILSPIGGYSFLLSPIAG
jgi:hypothetical protein